MKINAREISFDALLEKLNGQWPGMFNVPNLHTSYEAARDSESGTLTIRGAKGAFLVKSEDASEYHYKGRVFRRDPGIPQGYYGAWRCQREWLSSAKECIEYINGLTVQHGITALN